MRDLQNDDWSGIDVNAFESRVNDPNAFLSESHPLDALRLFIEPVHNTGHAIMASLYGEPSLRRPARFVALISTLQRARLREAVNVPVSVSRAGGRSVTTCPVHVICISPTRSDAVFTA
jgi:hypothetical protein